MSFSRAELGFRHLAFLTIGRLQRRQIALNARLDLLDAALNRAARERSVAGVDGLEPAAVDRHDRVGEEVQASTQRDELPASGADRWAVVLAKIGDRLEIRRQPARQPHHLDVARRFALQTSARLDLVDVAVDVDLQHRRGVVGRTARRFRHDALKPQPPQIQLVDKHVNRPHRIVFTYVIVKELGQQNPLRSVLALDKALHQELRLNASRF